MCWAKYQVLYKTATNLKETVGLKELTVEIQVHQAENKYGDFMQICVINFGTFPYLYG